VSYFLIQPAWRLGLTPPLPDGGGTHVITLGVFLTPLNKGSHTVSIKTRLDGSLISSLNFIEGDLIYTVIVQ
jgi:hypothetical protein